MASNQAASRQIVDGAITDAKVAAAAGIASSKLADGGNWVKKDGSVTMTGALNMGSQLITNLTTPSSSSDAATKSYVDAAIAALNALFDSKPSVRVATTANGTLSTAFANGQVVDGVTLVTGDRILLKNQSAPAENGIRVVAASGTPARALDMDAWNEVPGALVAVEEGTTNADTIWLSSANAGGTIDTTSITWQAIPVSAGYTTANFVDKETPSGSVNGSNTAFTLANTPVAGSVHLFINGQLQEEGSGNGYTITGTSITTTDTMLSGERIRASYRK